MTKYLHKKKDIKSPLVREIVFGLEDGMVSTLGAITGIAIGSSDHDAVILAGVIIIAVESISMGVGSYLSNTTERNMNNKILLEESKEIKDYPKEEKEELVNLFINDGWPKDLAPQMAEVASGNKKLILKEMAYREHGISQKNTTKPLKNAILMYFSYVFGGLIPLSSYFFLPIDIALKISIIATLLGLFLLGVVVSKKTQELWWRSGFRILLLGGIALVVGILAGSIIG